MFPLQRVLDKWQFVFETGAEMAYNQLGWRVARFGIVKFTSLPEEGQKFSKENFEGFMWHWRYWLPWERV